MTSVERVAVVGTGLIGTSIAMAAVRAGETVRGSTPIPSRWPGRPSTPGSPPSTLEGCVAGATVVFVCTPIPALAGLVAEVLGLAPDAIVTDVGSVKSQVMADVAARADPSHLERYIGGHPMGARSGRAPTTRRHRSSTAPSGSCAPRIRFRRRASTASRRGSTRSAHARRRWMPNATTGWSRW